MSGILDWRGRVATFQRFSGNVVRRRTHDDLCRAIGNRCDRPETLPEDRV